MPAAKSAKKAVKKAAPRKAVSAAVSAPVKRSAPSTAENGFEITLNWIRKTGSTDVYEPESKDGAQITQQHIKFGSFPNGAPDAIVVTVNPA